MKRVKQIFVGGKQLERLYHGRVEIRLETDCPRVEVSNENIRVVNASNLVNANQLIYAKLGTRSFKADEEFSELVSARYFFGDNFSTRNDFSGLKFPRLKDAVGLFHQTGYAAGYPSEFPEAVNFSYPFRGSNLKKFLFDLPKATSLYCAADNCPYLTIVDTNLPVCESAYHAFANNLRLKIARVISPRCVNYQTIFWEDPALESVEIINANSDSILSRVAIDHACINCPSLLTFAMIDTSRVYSADSAFGNTPKLQVVPLSYPFLFTGKGMFQGSNLSTDQVNAILESLPRHTAGSHVITFTGCPGAEDCNPEIATAKGWTVEI